MRNIILLSLSLVLVIGTSSFVQSPLKSAINTVSKIDTTKLCKTWYIVSGEMKAGGEVEPLPKDLINGKFIFYKNKKVKFVDPIDPNESEMGTWKDKNGKLYIDIDDDPMTFKVEILTNTKLKISTKNDGISAKMTFSSKPKK